MSKYYFERQCDCTSFPEHWCAYFRITVGRCPSMQITFRNQHVSRLQLVLKQRKRGGVIVQNYGQIVRNPIDIVVMFFKSYVAALSSFPMRKWSYQEIHHQSTFSIKEKKTSFQHWKINMHQSAYLLSISG